MVACGVLEPPPTGSLRPGPFRALAVRHGFDLEPLLPDPAPAWIDPEETFHPALTEPISALRLHRFPTPGSRAALSARLVSEPGHPDLDDPEDPWLGLFRFVAREDMEPEVTGTFALVLLRERLASVRRTWRPRLPPPEETIADPSLDVFAHRRARLVDTDWASLWDEVSAAGQFPGDDPALAFERATVASSAAWLADYRAWWQIAELLGPDETLEGVDRDRIAALLDAFTPDLGAAIADGAAAEAEFMDLVGTRPDGPVSARWLLGEQVRALRDLRSSNRERSLALHRLLRRTDVARVRVQLAYRARLLELWLAPDHGADREAALLEVPDPPHPTTLGAGLGRVVGMVLIRRLRRGDDDGATDLAERALHLAPQELAVRLTWNDLRHARGPRDAGLLASLKEEVQRWDSISARFMGIRTSETLGDKSSARQLAAGLPERALDARTGSAWAVAATLALRSPAGRSDGPRLEALVAAQQPPPDPPDPLAFVLFGEESPAEAWGDLELALARALDDLEQSRSLATDAIHLRGEGGKGAPRWRQLIAKKLVGPSHPDFAGRLFARIQALRATSPELRTEGVAAPLRLLVGQLAEAAELGSELPAELGEVIPLLGSWLEQPSAPAQSDLADRLGAISYPLMHALRRPRIDRLIEQLGAVRAELRVQGRAELRARADQLRARLADPDVDLARAAEDLGALARDQADSDPKLDPGAATEPGRMRVHPDFDAFSVNELGMLPEAVLRARQLVRLFNLSGGRRDKKRLRASDGAWFELRHRTTQHGGIRVFYRRDGDGWLATAAMSKYDDRQQRMAIERVLARFGEAP